MRTFVIYLLAISIPLAQTQASNWNGTHIRNYYHIFNHRSAIQAVKSSEPERTTNQKPIKPVKFSLFNNTSAENTPIVKSDIDKTQPLSIRETPDSNDNEEIAPKPIIEGADNKYEYGDLIRLSIKPLTTNPNNLHSVKYTWTLLPQTDHEIWPDSTRIIFSAGTRPQVFVIITTASYVYATPDTNGKIQITQKVSQTTTAIQIGSNQNIPNTPTANTPTATPQTPNLVGFSATVYEWAKLIQQSPSYNNTMIKEDAAKIAANFETIKEEIESNSLTDISAIVAATKNRNDMSLSRNTIIHWQPWFDKLTEHLRKEFISGNIQNKSALIKMWNDVAIALNQIAK